VFKTQAFLKSSLVGSDFREIENEFLDAALSLKKNVKLEVFHRHWKPVKHTICFSLKSNSDESLSLLFTPL